MGTTLGSFQDQRRFLIQDFGHDQPCVRTPAVSLPNLGSRIGAWELWPSPDAPGVSWQACSWHIVVMAASATWVVPEFFPSAQPT